MSNYAKFQMQQFKIRSLEPMATGIIRKEISCKSNQMPTIHSLWLIVVLSRSVRPTIANIKQKQRENKITQKKKKKLAQTKRDAAALKNANKKIIHHPLTHQRPRFLSTQTVNLMDKAHITDAHVKELNASILSFQLCIKCGHCNITRMILVIRWSRSQGQNVWGSTVARPPDCFFKQLTNEEARKMSQFTVF